MPGKQTSIKLIGYWIQISCTPDIEKYFYSKWKFQNNNTIQYLIKTWCCSCILDRDYFKLGSLFCWMGGFEERQKMSDTHLESQFFTWDRSVCVIPDSVLNQLFKLWGSDLRIYEKYIIFWHKALASFLVIYVNNVYILYLRQLPYVMMRFLFLYF